MSLAEFFDLRKRVNVLKRIKVDGKWKLYPAVVEPSRKLKDRVRVHGRLETHLEGSYCIEWREDGKRRRLSIPQRHQVLERARLKSLELEGLPVPQQVLPPGGFLLDPFGAGRQGRFLWHRFMLQLSLRSWGPGFDIGIGVGLVGWFPWAQASLLFPWYHFRGDYLRVINITNIRNVTNITNITNISNVHYAYRDIATTAIPKDVFSRVDLVANHAVSSA